MPETKLLRAKPLPPFSAMRFRFESGTSNGLQVLPEIPDVPTCLIEGRNGIGKTVAVRLLELISGSQPYAGRDRQWHSLRSRLGRTVVDIEGLHGDQKLVFTFTPEQWPAEGKPPLELGEWLGEVAIDGQEASVVDAQGLLWVERFAGNEDLDDTLRRRTQLYADHAQRTGTAVSIAASSLASVLDQLSVELRASDPAELDEARAQLAEAEASEKHLGEELSARVSRHELVLAAIRSRDRLRAAETGNTGARRELEQSRVRLEGLNAEREELEERIAATQSELQRQGDPQATLGDAQRAVRYRRKRVRNIEAEIDRLAATAGVDPDVDAVSKLEGEVRFIIEELEARRRAIDATGSTSRLIESLAALVGDPSAEALDDQTLIQRPEVELTVSETREGLHQRREVLRNEPSPDELEDIIHRLGDQQQRLAYLADLQRKISERARFEETLAQAEAEEKEAEQGVKEAGHRDEKYRADNQRLGVVEEEIDALNERITEIHIQLGLEGGMSPEDARIDLDKLIARVGLSSDGDLDSDEEEQRATVDRARLEAQQAEERVAALRRRSTVLSAAVDATISSLRTDERFAWLRQLVPMEEDLSLETYGRLHAEVLRLTERLDEARDLVQAVGQFAANALSDQKMVSDRELSDAVRDVLGDELRAGLDTQPIRDRVLGGARIEAVDLAARELILARDDDVEISPRPFDTFSTGEQAFAFTQARILELEPSTRPNRLLVLDEFGAFVAADRMPDLAEFLQSEQVSRIADQVLVILPLQLNYEAELQNTTGSLRKRFEARVEQLAKSDYYTQELDA